MIATLKHYRGVDYSVTPLRGGLWRWTAYQLVPGELQTEGLVAGSGAEAGRACRAAIDRVLGKGHPEAARSAA